MQKGFSMVILSLATLATQAIIGYFIYHLSQRINNLMTNYTLAQIQSAIPLLDAEIISALQDKHQNDLNAIAATIASEADAKGLTNPFQAAPVSASDSVSTSTAPVSDSTAAMSTSTADVSSSLSA
jgi:hypothetical protein